MYIDLLVKIKNAEAAKRKSIKVPYAKFDYAVMETLKKLGFLKKTEVKGRSVKKVVELELNQEKPVRGVRWLSYPSARRYDTYDRFRKVKGGYGALIVSTSKGVMTGDEARKAKVGGQLLFEIW